MSGSICSKCGRAFVGDIVIAAVATEDAVVGGTATMKSGRHRVCPTPAPSIFDDYPKKPGAGWLVWAARTNGLDTTGTYEQIAARLRDFGFDELEAPPTDASGFRSGFGRW